MDSEGDHENANALDSVLTAVEEKLLEGDPKTEIEMVNAIQNVRDFIGTLEEPIPNEFMVEVRRMASLDRHVQALIYLHALYDDHKVEDDKPYNELWWKQFFIHKITGIADHVIRSRDRCREIGIYLGFEKVKSILTSLRNMKNIDSRTMAEKVGSGLTNVSHLCGFMNEWKAMEDFCMEGINILKNEFGKDSVKYSSYGLLLCNLGWAYLGSGRLQEAESFYERAYEACKEATDFSIESKKKHIDFCQRYRDLVREKLRDK